jgi:hypothetical protein
VAAPKRLETVKKIKILKLRLSFFPQSFPQFLEKFSIKMCNYFAGDILTIPTAMSAQNARLININLFFEHAFLTVHC